MKLTQLLSEGHLLMPREIPSSPEELLKALIAPLVADGIVSDGQEFLEAVLEREEDMTTQMPGRVAIPHAHDASVRRLGMAVGLLPEPGLAYDPDNEEKCRLFFLIAVPANAPASHLELLSQIAPLISDKASLEALLASQDKETLTGLLGSQN